MTIKHLVLGGGGPFGLVAFGALKYLQDIQFWNIKDIKTIYATSVGAYVSVFLTLGYDYDYIYEYAVKRPWEKAFKDVGMDNFIDFYKKRGFIDLYPIYFRSYNILLEAKGLSPNITLKQYYDYCGIEFNFITTEVNKFSKVILSHKTYPDLELIKAICMTSSFPGVFRPIFIGDKCYTDGGIFCNYPLKICLEETACDINEILGIRKLYEPDNLLIDDNSTILEYLGKMLNNAFDYINNERAIPYIPYGIECDMNIFSDYETWINVPISQECRAVLIDTGANCGKSSYEKWVQQNIVQCGDNRIVSMQQDSQNVPLYEDTHSTNKEL